MEMIYLDEGDMRGINDVYRRGRYSSLIQANIPSLSISLATFFHAASARYWACDILKGFGEHDGLPIKKEIFWCYIRG